MGENKPGANGEANQEKEMGLDWAHTAEGWKQHHKTSAKMEPARKEKKRATKEHIHSGHISTKNVTG